jgi:hypothetical protein
MNGDTASSWPNVNVSGRNGAAVAGTYQASLKWRDLPGEARQAQGLPFIHDESLFHD